MTIYQIKIEKESEATLHICDDAGLEKIRPLAIQALKRGNVVTWFNGVTQWIDNSPIMNLDQEASDAYTWDESGNKIKNEILLYSKNGDTVEFEQIGTSFRSYLNYL